MLSASRASPPFARESMDFRSVDAGPPGHCQRCARAHARVSIAGVPTPARQGITLPVRFVVDTSFHTARRWLGITPESRSSRSSWTGAGAGSAGADAASRNRDSIAHRFERPPSAGGRAMEAWDAPRPGIGSCRAVGLPEPPRQAAQRSSAAIRAPPVELRVTVSAGHRTAPRTAPGPWSRHRGAPADRIARPRPAPALGFLARLTPPVFVGAVL